MTLMVDFRINETRQIPMPFEFRSENPDTIGTFRYIGTCRGCR